MKPILTKDQMVYWALKILRKGEKCPEYESPGRRQEAGNRNSKNPERTGNETSAVD